MDFKYDCVNINGLEFEINMAKVQSAVSLGFHISLLYEKCCI
jgi:hypothetical protein